MEQQREASTLGMWLFLATEIMFFGGLFTGYTVYRSAHPAIFAEASHRLNVYLGFANTVVLIGSSLTMVLAVWAAQIGSRKLQVIFLILTIILGTAFLGVKAKEYYDKFRNHEIPGYDFQLEKTNQPTLSPSAEAEVLQYSQMFFNFYFAMTGLHALHMVIGVVLLTILAIRAYKGAFTPEYHSPLELTGLYWHFVDIIWIFLFPLLYLIGFHER